MAKRNAFPQIASSEITPESVYLKRRDFMRAAGPLVEELLERPYITLGFVAWALMFPLALTSTRKMQRRLRANWLRLHRLAYPALLLACLHLLWQARSDIGEALVYLLLAGVLLGWRFRRRYSSLHKATVPDVRQ